MSCVPSYFENLEHSSNGINHCHVTKQYYAMCDYTVTIVLNESCIPTFTHDQGSGKLIVSNPLQANSNYTQTHKAFMCILITH